MRKILLTADPIGGVWTYALDLSRALGEQNVEVVLATMGARLRQDQQLEVAALPNVELHESQFALEWMQDPWRDVEQAGRWLLQLESRTKPDLIHLNGYVHAALHWRNPVLVVAHSCVLSWWRAVRAERAPEEWNEYRRRVAAGLEAADFVLAPSQAMLAALERDHGDLPRTGVIHNGRDSRRFRVSKKEPFVFSAGRFWDEAKNLAALKRAAALIDWPVHVAGSEGDRNSAGLVRLGRISSAAIAEHLSRASIFCLPARYEPFGLSALEAAFSRCALVLGDIASLREVWGDAALFVDPDDSKALADTLQHLIGHPAERNDLAQRALQRAQRYTMTAMASRYLSLYSAIIRQSRFVRQAA